MEQEIRNNLLARITIIPGMMGGKPTIRGMRFPVTDVLEMLTSGMTPDEILEQHPTLEKDDVHAALLYASLKIKNTVITTAMGTKTSAKAQEPENKETRIGMFIEPSLDNEIRETAKLYERTYSDFVRRTMKYVLDRPELLKDIMTPEALRK